jgi:hypothetical protein
MNFVLLFSIRKKTKMRASELISQLQKLIDEHGDLPVEIPSWGDIDYDDAEETRVYTYGLGGDFEYPVIMIGP